MTLLLRPNFLPDFSVDRRRVLALGGAALAGLVADPLPATAVTVDVTQGNVQPMPIAIPDFLGGAAGDNETAQGVSQIISANLKRSGLFAPIDPAAFLEKISSVDAVPHFPDWRTINAQALATGRVTRQTDGRLKAEFRPWDVLAVSGPLARTAASSAASSPWATRRWCPALPATPSTRLPNLPWGLNPSPTGVIHTDSFGNPRLMRFKHSPTPLQLFPTTGRC